MLVGTILGVLIIPGLYYIFANLAEGRQLLKDEIDRPLSEEFEHKKKKEGDDSYIWN
jgi:HAE1 family hydrophobic/amphiphilic exporter-1